MDWRCPVVLGVVTLLVAGPALGDETKHAEFSAPSPTSVSFVQGGAFTNNNANTTATVETYPWWPTLEDLKPPVRVVIQPNALSPHKMKK
jgi:hypothetical protein